MSIYAQQQLKAFGETQVIVMLKKTHTSAPESIQRLERHFCWGQRHQALKQAAARNISSRSRVHRKVVAGLPQSPMMYLRNLGLLYGTVDRKGWDGLRAETSVVSSVSGAPPIRPIRPATGERVDDAPKTSWGVKMLGVPRLWKQGLSGKGVRVAHLDTGVTGTHPALDGAIAEFAEFDPLGQLIVHPQPFDSGEHGTHTAGIIAGRPVNDRSIGMAPGASLISGIVIEGGDLVARVLAGVDWAIDKQARVLNLSLGFPGYWAEFVPLIKVIRSKGLLPVFAVGNEGPGTSRSPGNYPQALSVGAVDTKGEVLQDSSSQKFDRTDDPIVPDLVAPGLDIITADVEGAFVSDNGTSMAAPHVSGLAALLWEAKPAATLDEIEAAIYASCQRPVDDAVERSNRGIPDGPRALEALLHRVAPAVAAARAK
jgi:subtilisin